MWKIIVIFALKSNCFHYSFFAELLSSMILFSPPLSPYSGLYSQSVLINFIKSLRVPTQQMLNMIIIGSTDWDDCFWQFSPNIFIEILPIIVLKNIFDNHFNILFANIRSSSSFSSGIIIIILIAIIIIMLLRLFLQATTVFEGPLLILYLMIAFKRKEQKCRRKTK